MSVNARAQVEKRLRISSVRYKKGADYSCFTRKSQLHYRLYFKTTIGE